MNDVDKIKSDAREIAKVVVSSFCRDFISKTSILENIAENLDISELSSIQNQTTESIEFIELKDSFADYLSKRFYPLIEQNIFAFLTLDLKTSSILIDNFRRFATYNYPSSGNRANSFNNVFFKNLANSKYKETILTPPSKKDYDYNNHYSDDTKTINAYYTNLVKSLKISSKKDIDIDSNYSAIDDFINCYIREYLFCLYSLKLKHMSVYQEVYSQENFPDPANKTPLDKIPFVTTIKTRKIFNNSTSSYRELPFWQQAYNSYEKFYSLIEQNIIKPISINKISNSRQIDKTNQTNLATPDYKFSNSQ